MIHLFVGCVRHNCMQSFSPIAAIDIPSFRFFGHFDVSSKSTAKGEKVMIPNKT